MYANLAPDKDRRIKALEQLIRVEPTHSKARALLTMLTDEDDLFTSSDEPSKHLAPPPDERFKRLPTSAPSPIQLSPSPIPFTPPDAQSDLMRQMQAQ